MTNEELIKEIDQFLLEERRMPAGLLRTIQDALAKPQSADDALADTGDMLRDLCESSQYARFIAADGHTVGCYAASEISRRIAAARGQAAPDLPLTDRTQTSVDGMEYK